MFPEKYFLVDDYQEMEVMGITGLFTSARVDRESLPEGFYRYSFRDGDNDFLSTIEKDVWANHTGDFVCKQELDLGKSECVELKGAYKISDLPADVCGFFGVDLRPLIAQALEEFYYDYDPYDYADKVPPEASRDDVVAEFVQEFGDKKLLDGIIENLKEILEENAEEHFLDDRVEQTVRCLGGVLGRMDGQRRPALESSIEDAEEAKSNIARDNHDMRLANEECR